MANVLNSSASIGFNRLQYIKNGKMVNDLKKEKTKRKGCNNMKKNKKNLFQHYTLFWTTIMFHLFCIIVNAVI
jgi:ABC-type polar amino acid transport system ATPase subunit